MEGRQNVTERNSDVTIHAYEKYQIAKVRKSKDARKADIKRDGNDGMYIIVNAAMTVDGKIASKTGESAISSRHDLIRVHKLRSSVDAIMVGICTVLADNPMLNVRLVRTSKLPVRVIVDSKARIPLDSKIIQTSNKINTIVAVSNMANKKKIKAISDSGAMVVVAGKSTINLFKLMASLEKMKIHKVLVEGGGELNWSVISQKMFNELVVTISPRIVGGRTAPSLVEGEGFLTIHSGIKLKIAGITRYKNGEITLRYLPVSD